MTNKEAIYELKMMKRMVNADSWADKALDLAIKALEPDEEVNEFDCPYCGDVTYTATDYVPRFCQECGRDMGFREAEK